MDSSTTQVIAILVLLVAFALNVIVHRRNTTQRPIPAFQVLPALVSESIEANRPLHLSLGSASIGSTNTLLALAGADFLYYAARQTTIGDASPIVTVTDTAALPIGMDVLRRAYLSTNRPQGFQPRQVRWYPAGPRSLSFAGGVMAMQNEDDISANILAGSFGIELALMIHAAKRRKQPVVAATDQLAGQAVAFAMADYPLIGDELFAAGGYLSDDPSLASRNVTIDVLRVLVAGVIMVLVVVNLVWRG